MVPLSPALSAVLVLAAAACAAAAVFAATRRLAPGRWTFAALSLAIGLWCATSLLHGIAPAPDLRLFWARVQSVPIAATPVLWLLFAAEYGRAPWTRRVFLRRALWAVPVLEVALILTNDFHRLWWSATELRPTRAGTVLLYEHGPTFWAAAAFNYACLALGSAHVIDSLRRTPRSLRGQSAAILAGVAFPWVGNAVYLLGPTNGVDLTSLGFALSAACVGWGIFRYELLDVVPVAREQVLDAIAEGVLVVDVDGRVLDMNAAAWRLCNATGDWTGLQAGSVCPWWRPLSPDVPGGRADYVAELDGGRCVVEVSTSRVIDADGVPSGWLTLLRDVTARAETERARRELARQAEQQRGADTLLSLASTLAFEAEAALGRPGAPPLTFPVPPRRPRRGSRSEARTRRLASLIGQLLSHARNAGATMTTIDVDAIVRDVVSEAQGSMPGGGDRVRYYALADRPLWARGQAREVHDMVSLVLADLVDALAPDDREVVVSTGVDWLNDRDLARMAVSGATVAGQHAFVEIHTGRLLAAASLQQALSLDAARVPADETMGLSVAAALVRRRPAAIRIDPGADGGAAIRIWLLASPPPKASSPAPLASQ